MIFDVPAWSFVFYSRFFSGISVRLAGLGHDLTKLLRAQDRLA
jgi:hypothetical protein